MAQPSDRVEALITRLIAREGGYVDHPADGGGPTKFGITQATLSAWRGVQVTPFQVQTMQEAEARLIYRDRYFIAPGFEAVTDPALQEFLFDTAVNSGHVVSIRTLQTALAGLKLYSGAIDGIIGPGTRAGLLAGRHLVGEIYYRAKCSRYDLLLRFIGRDTRQAVFASGWANRLNELQYS